ncbi:MAG: SLC13 family permease [Chloroflexota bacterium]|nr:SLC13 family permease [Chloroflexota bacterium]MDE2919648.1 SLC13 family permease [Chloroflexota bacterium]
MTPEAWIVIGCVIGALVLFASERLPPEAVGVLVLLILALTGVIDAPAALSGFASPAVITVAAMFILSAGLVEAGAPAALASAIVRYGGTRIVVLTALLVLVVGGMSAFINNIAATVILMPAAVTLARAADASSSRLLMPLAFGSMLGGLMTQIGTPPNLLVSDALAAAGERPFGMFDFAPTGIAILIVGLLYLVTVGRRLVPDRQGPDVAQGIPQARDYMAEVRVPAGATMVGKTLRELRWRPRFDISVMEIVRDRHRLRFPTAEETLFVGDVVLVEGEPDDVLRLTQVEGLDFASERDFASGGLRVEDEQATVLELVAGPGFSSRGLSIAAMRFRNRFGGLVLGIWRQGTHLRTRLRDQRIETGDVLMVRMPSARVPDLEESTDFIVLSQRARVVVPRPRMLVPLAILVLVVGLAAANVAHIAVTGILGAVLMVVTRVLPYDRIYAAVEWRTIVLIAALLPLGTAMQTTGLAENLAQAVAGASQPLGPIAVLAGIFIFTSLLTQLMSNAAAVVLVAPIGLGIAASFGIAPHPVLMMVAIAGSTAFMTPIGHQSNVLIYNTGAFRFADFIKAGAPLTLIVLIVSLIVVPIVWPL